MQLIEVFPAELVGIPLVWTT